MIQAKPDVPAVNSTLASSVGSSLQAKLANWLSTAVRESQNQHRSNYALQPSRSLFKSGAEYIFTSSDSCHYSVPSYSPCRAFEELIPGTANDLTFGPSLIGLIRIYIPSSAQDQPLQQQSFKVHRDLMLWKNCPSGCLKLT